jgi:AAA family ATP:ADP antiporter
MPDRSDSLMLSDLLRKSVKLEANEVRATLVSFSFVLVLMAAYYILRPVRDAMASDWTDAEVSWLWTLNFFISAVVVSLYGGAVTSVKFRNLVASVYTFFAISFLAFYLGTQLVADRVLVDKSFYVWISVFSLFHVSVFWSFMADLFTKAQSLRLFGFIGAGASVGGLVGPAIPTFFVGAIGTDNLMLVASLMLLLTLPIIGVLQRLKITDLHNENQQADLEDFEYIGGNPLAGFTEFVKNPYLISIGVFILLYTSISSFVYFELKNLLEDYTRAQRTQIWSSMDLAVNILTILTAFFVTGRVASKYGVGVTLASVPFAICGGMLVVAAAPMVAVVVGLQILRRAGNYGMTRPGREMLFTAVDRETRFKAKPVIDIVVYRGGDTLNAWFFTALTQGLGLGLGAVALVGALIAAIWGGVGLYLGGAFNRQQLEPGEATAVDLNPPSQ